MGMGKLSEYVTAAQAAEILGVTKPRVNQLTRDGRLAVAGTVGAGVRLYRRAAVEAFAAKPRPRTGRPAGAKDGAPRKREGTP